MIALNFSEIDDTHFEMKDKNGNTYFHYEYIAEYKISIQTWFDFLPEDDIIRVYKQIAAFAMQKQQPIRVGIANLLDYDGSFHLSNDWVINNYMAKAVKVGFQYSFFVKSKDLFAQLALEEAMDMLRNIEGMLEVKMFESLEEVLEYSKKL